MTPTETIAILRKYNVWRRGNLDGQPMPDPRVIGEAIDAAVEMIDRLEAAEKERDALYAELAQLHKEADKFGDGIDWIQRALQAEAQIEAMERQEPIGGMLEVSPHNYELRWYRPVPFGTKLYTLPGAQTQGE